MGYNARVYDVESGKNMTFLVFSDSHSDTNGIDRAIEKHKNIKYIIHCGDVAADVEYLEYVYGTSHCICGVCGNNDYFCNDPLSRIISIEDHRIYVTHGHKEHVKQGLYSLASAARNAECDICIYGHTHVQHLTEENGITYLNPGSIGYLKSEYAVISVEKDNVKITLHKL